LCLESHLTFAPSHFEPGKHALKLPGPVPLELGGYVRRCQADVVRCFLLLQTGFNFCGAPCGSLAQRVHFQIPAAMDECLLLLGAKMRWSSPPLSILSCLLTMLRLAQCSQVFTGIGLRHLLVVNSAGNVVGIITRKDLVRHLGIALFVLAACIPPMRRHATSCWAIMLSFVIVAARVAFLHCSDAFPYTISIMQLIHP